MEMKQNYTKDIELIKRSNLIMKGRINNEIYC